MNKPTYDELELENKRLRSKLSFGQDEEFTAIVKEEMPTNTTMHNLGFEHYGKITIRPGELWGLIFDTEPSTTELAKLGRSLQALGWARSARRGNLVFTIPVSEYAK